MKPTIAQKAPYAVEVESGKSYYWCSCGLSKNQPFCDGSHQGTSFTPVEYKATENETIYFCGCKNSKNGVLCDGSHSSL
jgi:CDGSH-type Zn-finger protein